MDDGETTIFMEAMRVNSSITVLDFSNNLIGGMHEKLQCGAITGGKAIAQASHKWIMIIYLYILYIYVYIFTSVAHSIQHMYNI
jgi:hypothetical protein